MGRDPPIGRVPPGGRTPPIGRVPPVGEGLGTDTLQGADTGRAPFCGLYICVGIGTGREPDTGRAPPAGSAQLWLGTEPAYCGGLLVLVLVGTADTDMVSARMARMLWVNMASMY